MTRETLRSKGHANRHRRRPDVLKISVARDEAREPRLAVSGGGARVLAEKVDERLLDIGRHARSLAAHKHRRLDEDDDDDVVEDGSQLDRSRLGSL